jgi:xanthine dehydrogenase accessory factor
MTESFDADPACEVAHGRALPSQQERKLLAVFASPVAEYLLNYGNDLGFQGILLEPDADRASDEVELFAPFEVVTSTPMLDATTDVVVTDHHRPELGPVLREVLAHPARWIGVLGNPRHPAPHVAALAELGVAEDDIARVHRPVGLNIGSRTPPEIAIATLAGLLADRNNRPGGFEF